ncbi:uncharacterized protein LOC110684726 [Chenopodium quinoa]|uniref:uncharacterized protein LOC110684726 n=1 Tax=Chenopodium quinoa TaxID=63459 RepID=UPI000B79A834|nr:uncharacterized protein LOC110684726 [Chenopodium quinoa]
MPKRGLVKTLENFILGKEDDDLLYEDRVFQFVSRNSAKFLVVLIIVPWAMDFLVHDYVLMPFLDSHHRKPTHPHFHQDHLHYHRKPDFGPPPYRRPPTGTTFSAASSCLISEAFQKKSKEASTQGIQKTLNELYWETVGGRNKKGRVKGLGEGSELYYANRKGIGSKSSKHYTPSLLSQMKDQVEQRVEQRAKGAS